MINNKCLQCNSKNTITISHNKFINTTICFDCVKNGDDIEVANKFCKFVDIPFELEEWLNINKAEGDKVFKIYYNIKNTTLTPEEKRHHHYNDSLWEETQKEWKNIVRFNQVMQKIEPIKEGYVDLQSLKWGTKYSFEDLMKLEALFNDTTARYDIKSPLKIESLRMICELMLQQRAYIRDDLIEDAQKVSKVIAQNIKIAGLEEDSVDVKDNILETVADLAALIEKSGGKFEFNFEGLNKDIVDKTIEDMQKYTADLVDGATGLREKLLEFAEKFYREKSELANVKSEKETSLEDLKEHMEERFTEAKEEFEKIQEDRKQEVINEFDGDDDDLFKDLTGDFN